MGIMDAGMSLGIQITGDDTVFDLEGSSSYMGFSAGGGGFVGIDAVASGITMAESLHYDGSPNGIMISAGFGVGFDVHLKETYTETIKIFKEGQ